MVEKVFISPNRVRAYGNIVNMKTGDDFTLVNSELTVTTDMVGGAEMTVFSMEVEPRITVTATNPYLLSGETTDLVVSLVNAFGSPLSGKTVTVTGSDGSLYNGITNSNGTYTKTGVSVTGNATFTAAYNGATSSCDVYYPCLLVDYATTNKHTDVWNNMSWFTRADDGTSVYYQNTGSSNQQRNTDYLSFDGKDVAIDFQLINSTYCRVQVQRRDSGSQWIQCNYHNASGKVHIEIKTTGTYFYLDDTLFYSNTAQLNQSDFRLFFLTEVNKTTNFKYKDLRIYYL